MTDATTELTTFTPDNPVAVLTNPQQFDALLDRIRAEVEGFDPDTATAKGRKAIASLAYKVARTKTALDDAGKELNASKRREIDAVDAVRRDIRDKLDALSAQARKPLDEWEAAEAARKARADNAMARIDRIVNDPGETADSIAASLAELSEPEHDLPEGWAEIIEAKRSTAIDTLTAMHGRAVRAEADAAELAELRRCEADRAEAEAAKAAEAARIEAERLAAERAAQQAAEAEARRQAEIRAAEERAAREAEDRILREADAKVRVAEAETARIRREAEIKAEEEHRAAAQQAARDADKANRASVMKAAKEAIMSHCDVDEPAARRIVLAIVAGTIPNIAVRF